MVNCNEVFLESADCETTVKNCGNVTAAEKGALSDNGRGKAIRTAKEKCPSKCSDLVYIRDNHTIINSCANGVLKGTYEGWFKCVSLPKKSEVKIGSDIKKRKTRK